MCVCNYSDLSSFETMNKASYSVSQCLVFERKIIVLTLFDYKLAVQLFLGPTSNIEFLQRPAPSGLSLIELHYDGLVLTAV